MNRAQRRRTSRLRQATLSLMVAATLTTVGVADLYAETADPVGDLTIQGGGGGEGGCLLSGSGGGGGGYVAITDADGTIIAYAFGGGGDGGSSATGTGGGGGIGGGGTNGGVSGGSGGASGPFAGGVGLLGGQGNGDGVADGGTGIGLIGGLGTPASTFGVLPIGLTATPTRGESSEVTSTELSGGDGIVSATGLIVVGKLHLISGEQGSSGAVTGGLGGAARFEGVDCSLDARMIILDKTYAGSIGGSAYTGATGAVDLAVGTLISRKGYQLSSTGIPTVSISAFEFDVTDAVAGDTLLDSSITLDVTGKPVVLSGAPSRLVVDDEIILLNNATGSFAEQQAVMSSSDYLYHFNIELVEGELIATVTEMQALFTISYDANGGSGTMASDTVPAGSDYAIRPNAFTRDGFIFVGWNTLADGSGVGYGPEATLFDIQANLTLYAQWKAEDTPQPPDTPEVPSTGDSNPLIGLAVMLSIATLVVLSVSAWRKLRSVSCVG